MPIINSVITTGGIQPSGTKQITTNGTHDVSAYANADVQVPTTAPAHYVEKVVNANGKLVSTTNIINLSGATDVADYLLDHQYYNVSFPANTIVDFSFLTAVNGVYAFRSTFQNCSGITSADLSGVVSIENHYGPQGGMFRNMFTGCTDLTSVDLSSLTTIAANYGFAETFKGCTGLTSVNLEALITITSTGSCQRMFEGCTSLATVSFGALTEILSFLCCEQTFKDCTSLTSVDLSSLTKISDTSPCLQMFQNCTGLTVIDFCSLTNISGSNKALSTMFQGCTNLARLSFYALDTNSFGTRTSQFENMIPGVTGCTVHFPMRIQSTISSWSDVTNGFGGTNTTVLFDIVCTLTGADTNTYTRSQKNSTSTATAWDNGGTLYYTSGTTEPVVGDTIYSDAACTVAVTTINSIA